MSDIHTANKALIALHGNEIFAAAQAQGVVVAFEAAVQRVLDACPDQGVCGGAAYDALAQHPRRTPVVEVASVVGPSVVYIETESVVRCSRIFFCDHQRGGHFAPTLRDRLGPGEPTAPLGRVL